MYAANFAASPETASAIVTEDIVGTIEEGTVKVKFFETAVPIFVLPEYVVTVTVAVPEVDEGIPFIQVKGIAYDVDVPTFDAVYEYDPKENFTVCVKLLEALVIETAHVFVPFIATEAVTEAIVDALAIVLNTPVPDAGTVPKYVPDNVTLIPASHEKEHVFDPSVPCGTVTVFVKIVFV
jgi:hypothetical protein